jgi:hypothetical protein
VFWTSRSLLPFGLFQYASRTVERALSSSNIFPRDRYFPEPISARAWTLQERLLSQRVLWFPSKAYKIEWHCNTIQQNDCGIIEEPFWSDTKPLLALLFRSQARSSSPIPIHRLCYKWSEIVENYGLRSLTDSGISYVQLEALLRNFIVSGGAYYAGLPCHPTHVPIL